MGADQHVDAAERRQQVQTLAFEHLAVAVADARMGQDDHHVRMLFRADAVHPFLCAREQRLEVDAAPDGLGEPGLHIGIGQA